MGDYGSVCRHHDEIMDAEDCKSAAIYLGVVDQNANGWNGESSAVPKGCSVQRHTDCASYTTTDGSLHINTHSTGGRSCDLAPICKESGKWKTRKKNDKNIDWISISCHFF